MRTDVCAIGEGREFLKLNNTVFASSQAAFNLSNVYFLERIRRKKIFLSKIKKECVLTFEKVNA